MYEEGCVYGRSNQGRERHTPPYVPVHLHFALTPDGFPPLYTQHTQHNKPYTNTKNSMAGLERARACVMLADKTSTKLVRPSLFFLYVYTCVCGCLLRTQSKPHQKPNNTHTHTHSKSPSSSRWTAATSWTTPRSVATSPSRNFSLTRAAPGRTSPTWCVCVVRLWLFCVCMRICMCCALVVVYVCFFKWMDVCAPWHLLAPYFSAQGQTPP